MNKQWIAPLVVISTAVLVALFLRFLPTDASGMASWLQAIGSVIGIGIAIYVPWRQQQNQIGEQKRADLAHRLFMVRRLRALVDELVLAAVHLHGYVQTFGAVGGAHGFTYDQSSLTVLSDAARRIEEQDREFDAGHLTLSIRMQVTEMKRKVESHLGRAHHALDADFLGLTEGWLNKAKAFQATAVQIVAHAEKLLEKQAGVHA